MRRMVAALVVVLAVFGVLVVASPAQADPYLTYLNGCHKELKTTNFAYYYAAGGYNVYATNWEDYNAGVQSAPVQPDPCYDINVEIWNTGGFVVRTLICPYGGNCYALSWGSLNQFTTYGATAPAGQMPCGGVCAFQFRVETTTAENMRIGW